MSAGSAKHGRTAGRQAVVAAAMVLAGSLVLTLHGLSLLRDPRLAHYLISVGLWQRLVADAGLGTAPRWVAARIAAAARALDLDDERSATVATTKPGVQKPHIRASTSQNACCTGCIVRFAAARPSTVRTALPWTSTASVEHE